MNQVNKFLNSLSEEGLFNNLSKGPGTWIFRGQPEIHPKIIPGVGRYKLPLPKEEECQTYDQFRRAFPRFNMTDGDDWEMLARAQHHGLPTRLLDWTFNPLTALFFAVHDMGNKRRDDHEDDNEPDGVVYALRTAAESAPNQKWNDWSPFEFKGGEKAKKKVPQKARRFWPKDISERVFAQEGLFVWFKKPSVSLERQIPPSWEIKKFQVPRADKAELRKQLDFLGFTHARLFPDMDGLAKTLSLRM